MTADPDRLAGLLAPLPASAEPVQTPEFCRTLRAAESHRWRSTMRHFFVAEHERNRAGMERSIAFDEATPEELAVAEAGDRLALARLVLAVDRQMRLAAPNREALRWKLRWRELDHGRAAWDEAIRADEERLGPAARGLKYAPPRP